MTAPSGYAVAISDSGQWNFLLFGYSQGHSRVDFFPTDSLLTHDSTEFANLMAMYQQYSSPNQLTPIAPPIPNPKSNYYQANGRRLPQGLEFMPKYLGR